MQTGFYSDCCKGAAGLKAQGVQTQVLSHLLQEKVTGGKSVKNLWRILH